MYAFTNKSQTAKGCIGHKTSEYCDMNFDDSTIDWVVYNYEYGMHLHQVLIWNNVMMQWGP